jgi:hypothetical protein
VDALLLGSWPESVFACEAIWSRLAERAHLVAVDLPGLGRPKGNDTAMSPRAIGDFLAHAADALGLEHPHVVGSGGTVVPIHLGERLHDSVFAPLEPYRGLGGPEIVERVIQTLERYVISDAAGEG